MVWWNSGGRLWTSGRESRTPPGVRALFKGVGVQNLPRRQQGMWAKKGLAVLCELELPSSQDRLRRDQLMDELDQINQQVKRIERELDLLADDHPRGAGVALLRSVPRVGARTAEAAPGGRVHR